MSNLSYEESKKKAFKGMTLLAIITIIEVVIALLGNGHVIEGFHLSKWLMYPAMIGLSLYKAYYIIFEFMHLRYEGKALALTMVLPMVLLVWGIIAFLHEGNAWGKANRYIELLNEDGYRKIEVMDERPAKKTEASPSGNNEVVPSH